jgi:mycothiol synthase
VQSARREDAPAVADLLTTCRAVFGESPVTPDEVLDDWDELEDLADEVVVVVAPDGRVVAEADVLHRRFVRVSVYGSVHPAEEGKGLGSVLVDWAERWIDNHLHRAPEGVQVVLEFYTNAANDAARRLLEARGYPLVRTVYVMRIDLTGPLPAPRWPQGIELRTFQQDSDAALLFEAAEDAFRDMWSRPPGTLDSWTAATQAQGFDSGLWFLPMGTTTREVAGFCICAEASGAGWVRSLGVRRAWRHRGLGLALLHHAFGEFYRRAIHRIELSVDAESPTGAPRLYTRAGMRVTQSYGIYRREIRSGQDFTEALT